WVFSLHGLPWLSSTERARDGTLLQATSPNPSRLLTDAGAQIHRSAPRCQAFQTTGGRPAACRPLRKSGSGGSLPVELVVGAPVELLPGGPQAGRRGGDVVDLLAVGHGVPAVLHHRRVVAAQRLLKVHVPVADRLDLLPGEMPRGIGDREAALGGAVDEVRGAVRDVLHVGLRLVEVEHLALRQVPVLADEVVHLRLLPEALDAGGDDEQLPAV